MIHTTTNELHKLMDYKTINARFSSEIVTNQATVTSSVELQPVYAMYRIFAMVKNITQVKNVF